MVMLVVIGIFPVDVDVAMGVGVLVGVNCILVAMLMAMDVGMLVSMLKLDGVFYHKIGADYHNRQGDIEAKTGSFA